jgi:hypothetical protein
LSIFIRESCGVRIARDPVFCNGVRLYSLCGFGLLAVGCSSGSIAGTATHDASSEPHDGSSSTNGDGSRSGSSDAGVGDDGSQIEQGDATTSNEDATSPTDASIRADANANDASTNAHDAAASTNDGGTLAMLGIGGPTGSGQITQALADFKSTNAKSVRVWLSIATSSTGGWNTTSPVEASSVAAIKTYKQNGFLMVAALVPENGIAPTDASQVNAVIDYVMTTSGLKDVVDIWELGNEPDHATYWASTDIADYTKKYLIPAGKRIHQMYGKKTANAPPSWNWQDVKTMFTTEDPDAPGTYAVSYVDYANLHFYGSSMSDISDKLDSFATYAKTVQKPTMATEWSMNNPGNDADWAAAIKGMWPLVQTHLNIAHYYTYMQTNTDHGEDGIVDTNQKHRDPFWTMYAGF